jgi:hypothetical protein
MASYSPARSADADAMRGDLLVFDMPGDRYTNDPEILAKILILRVDLEYTRNNWRVPSTETNASLDRASNHLDRLKELLPRVANSDVFNLIFMNTTLISDKLTDAKGAIERRHRFITAELEQSETEYRNYCFENNIPRFRPRNASAAPKPLDRRSLQRREWRAEIRAAEATIKAAVNCLAVLEVSKRAVRRQINAESLPVTFQEQRRG